MTDGTSRSNSNHTSTQMYTLTQSPGLGRSQARIQAGPAQKSGRTPVSLHPYWMHTLTALWLCIPEGLWHEVGPHACAWVCVCVCEHITSSRAGRAETPSVSASEPLHGHWTQALCSHRVRSSRYTAVRADWSMSSPFQGVKVLS